MNLKLFVTSVFQASALACTQSRFGNLGGKARIVLGWQNETSPIVLFCPVGDVKAQVSPAYEIIAPETLALMCDAYDINYKFAGSVNELAKRILCNAPGALWAVQPPYQPNFELAMALESLTFDAVINAVANKPKTPAQPEPAPATVDPSRN